MFLYNITVRYSFFLLILLLPVVSHGLTVTNNADSGSGSLRDAIANTPAGGTVDFAVTGTITLLSEIVIASKDLTIRGPGADQLTISGGNSTRIFRMTGSPGVNTIVVSGLRLANGFVNGNGGAIKMRGPNLELNNCVFDSNTATCDGGGCRAQGAAIRNESGPGLTIVVNNSTFTSNSSSCVGTNCDAVGAGIHNGGGGPGLRIVVNNSTFASNSSSCVGTNCDALGAGIGNGGGAVTIEVNNSTFASNSSSCEGTNCFQSGSSISTFLGLIIYSSIFFTDSPEGNCMFTGNIVSLGYNIDNGSTCITGAVTGDKQNTPPGLDPAGAIDNGGPTPTIALLKGSPAIDMGDPNCPPPATDQRGVSRPQGPRCDIGAFELEVIMASPIPTLSEWGLIAVAGVLGILGFMVIRRRKVSA